MGREYPEKGTGRELSGTRVPGEGNGTGIEWDESTGERGGRIEWDESTGVGVGG